MASISIAILGLGRVGLSVGLALKRYNASKGARQQFQITGADTRPIGEDAHRSAAVDNIARTLRAAVQGKDMVVMALPYSDVQAAYRDIGAELRDGAVVLDLSPLKLPSLQWAQANLQEQAYMVGVTPVLNPDYLFVGLDEAAHAHADLFDRGSWLLMPAPGCPKDAVELAADFGRVLGATAHFMDAAEHDTLAAATEGLPVVLGLAAFYGLQQRKAWDDAQRLTNPAFGRLTHHLADTHPDDLRDLLLSNAQNTVHYLDAAISTLQALREVLERKDREALEAALIESAEAYRVWLNHRQTGRWADEQKATPSGSFTAGLMGGYLSGKLRGDRDEDRK